MKKCLFFFGIFLAAAQQGFAQNSLSHSLYNTLYSKDCDIPEQAQIVHYPMIHPAAVNLDQALVYFFNRENEDADDVSVNEEIPLSVISDDDETTMGAQLTDSPEPAYIYQSEVYSGFQFIQLLKKHPMALVFEETVWDLFVLEQLEGIRKGWNFWNKYIAGPFAVLFNTGFDFQTTINSLKYTSSYSRLGVAERRVLSSFTGGAAAFLTGVVDRLYPVTPAKSSAAVVEQYPLPAGLSLHELYLQMDEGIENLLHLSAQFRDSQKEEERKKIKFEFYQLYKKLKYQRSLIEDFFFPYRESLLYYSVISALNDPLDNQMSPVIIAYGAAHDFSDEFSSYNFYTIPYACSFLESDDAEFYTFLTLRYTQEANEENKDIMFEFLQEKWNQMSKREKARLQQELERSSDSQFLISNFEKLRRILNKESFSEEEDFEFIFQSFVSGEICNFRTSVLVWEMSFHELAVNAEAGGFTSMPEIGKKTDSDCKPEDVLGFPSRI